MTRDDRYFRFLRLKSRVMKEWARFRGNDPNVDMALMTGQYERIWREAAHAISGSFREISEGFWEVRARGRATLIQNFKVRIDDPVVLNLAGDKALCYRLMQEEGLSIPDHVSFRVGELAKARNFLEKRAGALFVVKPSKGTAGARGVTTHVATDGELLRAAALASLYCDEIIVERLIPGEPYRFLVLDGAVIHVSRRRGYRVTGDGRASIQELARRGETTATHSGGEKRLPFLLRDRDVRATLDAQGLTPESVPRDGEEVLVRSNRGRNGNYAEHRTCYDEAVADVVCEDLKDQAVRAARAVKSLFAGVDLITTDPTVPLAENGGAINEVNTTPGLHNHYNLLRNGGDPVAVKVLEYLLSRDVGPIDRKKRVGHFNLSGRGG